MSQSGFTNPTRTEAISRFLKLHTHSDLAALYTHDMEVQVNVNKGNGQRVDAGDFKGREWVEYTNGTERWKPFRIPFNANSDPTYNDTPMTFSLEEHAEGIGMTGWDWKSKLSRWVAFDFDAITGHSDSHSKKLTDVALNEIQETVRDLPFVTVRKSTSGKGLHLYVMLEPVETANHNEHAALARAILSMLSGLTGFDFASKVDVCGSNMWVWHRKMTTENGGLQIIKTGEILTKIPPNWKEHVNVVSKRASRTNPSTFSLEELSGQNARISLDGGHRALINWLASNNCCWEWNNDNHMLITHTYHLKEAHTALNLCGQFETISTGSERGNDINCFMYPMRGGAWAVRRFSPGTKEHDLWDQNGKDWTKCIYNREPDFQTLARIHKGVEQEKGGFQFRHASDIVAVFSGLGIHLDLPSWIMSRVGTIKPNLKDGKLVVHLTAESGDNGSQMVGWLNEKKLWKRVFRVTLPHANDGDNSENYDDFIRHIVSAGDKDAGWVIKRENSWAEEPLAHVKLALAAAGRDGKEIVQIVGSSVMKAWQLVNKPFQPEYPGNREWNRGAAQLAVIPTSDLDDLKYPTWTKIMEHCGGGLNDAIANNEWCREVGITSGKEFLMLWIASMFRRPRMPTTYLAFYGPQNSGKSIFHEAISQILVTSGVMRADNALQSDSNFNGELANAILCVVEETDLKANKAAYNRIKDWVTSPEIMIRPLYAQGYMMPNCTHWVQCANEIDSCPVFPGDTRITLIHVPELKERIPKDQLMQILRKEAPDFLAAILSMELPPSHDRLAVPTIETESKNRAADKNMTLLEQFIKENVKEIDGYCIDCNVFYEEFMNWLEADDRPRWSKNKIGRDLSDRFPKGRVGSNQTVHYGNMMLLKDFTNQEPKMPFKQFGLFIRQEK